MIMSNRMHIPIHIRMQIHSEIMSTIQIIKNSMIKIGIIIDRII